jgi:two-component system sensor histidine kinase ChvG
MADIASDDAKRPARAGRRERRRAAARDARLEGAPQPSRLTRRIVGFNLIGLGLLVVGVLALNDFRGQLIDLRTKGLETQAKIIAVALAESAARRDGLGVDVDSAQVVLDRLVEPTSVRARVFDRGARLMLDTRLNAGPGGVVEEVSPPAARFDETGGALERLDAARRWLLGLFGAEGPATARDEALGGLAALNGVYAALGEETAHEQRVNARGELIVSVSVPIMRLEKVHGALVLSTRGGDIDAIVRSERVSILQVFLVALAVSVVLSVLSAKAIGRPIERLAEAALAAERGGRPPERGRVQLPDMTARGDEIGYLSGALKRMTEALYNRIEATEAFAADVAHEIKNPLSSLRSAVETMRYARSDDDRARLLAVIEHDVARLDRLVTDISNASRLDAELVREAREPFDLAALLRTLVEFNQPKAEARGVRLRDEGVQAPLTVRGIEGRLAQVFVNVIDNALSFSPQGSEIRLSAARGPGGRVRVTVEDEGPGIPDANLGSVFERFYSERPRGEAFGDHSGLGLSISRQIVEAHGGEIRAENVRPEGAARRGARFVVELPG